MHLKIGYFLRPIAALNRLGLALKPRLWLCKALRAVFPIVIDGPTWLFKLLLKVAERLIARSRSDADAQAALAILKQVHGKGAMYRDRIAVQMCREPDEELSYYSTVAHGNMSVIVYNLPSGCRLWFNMLPDGEIAVGWGFLQPQEDDGEMFWRRQPAQPGVRSPRSAGLRQAQEERRDVMTDTELTGLLEGIQEQLYDLSDRVQKEMPPVEGRATADLIDEHSHRSAEALLKMQADIVGLRRQLELGSLGIRSALRELTTPQD